MNGTKKKLLEDVFEINGYPFRVRVWDRMMSYNRKTERIRFMSPTGTPAGVSRPTRNWMSCKARVAQARPDYPIKKDVEWPEHADKKKTSIWMYERPEKQLLFWTVEERDGEAPSARRMAIDAITNLMSEYQQADRVASLDVSGVEIDR
jgi:hypothetical protein